MWNSIKDKITKKCSMLKNNGLIYKQICNLQVIIIMNFIIFLRILIYLFVTVNLTKLYKALKTILKGYQSIFYFNFCYLHYIITSLWIKIEM